MAVINRLPALMGEKQAKENRVINVATISEETGVSRQTIYQWLRGDVSQFRAETIEALCDYFECDVADLLYIKRELEQTS